MKKIIITLIFGLLIVKADAQGDIDALRYSNIPTLGTTARSMSMGGAIGAMGADASVALINPAGLAQYKSSQFSFSLGTLANNVSASVGDGTKGAYSFSGELPNVSFIFTNRKTTNGNPNKRGWVNSNFLLSYNRTANFNNSVRYETTSPKSSYTDYVANYSQGLASSDLGLESGRDINEFFYFENMFWYSYLIDSVSDGQYGSVYDKVNGISSQRGKINTSGGAGEYTAAFAANFEHKFYFGAALNVHQINYTELNEFSEVDNPLTQGNWDTYEFSRRLETRGTGFSGRLGVVFRPNSSIRIGASVHTPTRLNLTDEYYDELTVTEDSRETYTLTTIDKTSEYQVVTPGRYSLQGAYIFGKQGLISAEIESVNYATMNLSNDNDDFDLVNEDILDRYRSATNLKLGAEYNMGSFKLRGGYASMGNPLAEGNYSSNVFSGGFGFYDAKWSFDVGVSRRMTKDEYVPYDLGAMSPVVQNELAATRLMITISTKF